jgi:hypothetical protein
MKQIFLASTLFEVACLAAGIDAGAYDTGVAPHLLREPGAAPTFAPIQVSERILLTSNNAQVLEQVTPLTEVRGVTPLLERFDRVISLNELVTPRHPSSWAPPEQDLPMLQRLIRREWDLGDEEVELVLESPQVNPAIALGRIFCDALIRVHADGLMTYGPTRNRLPLSLGQRMTSLHYLPLVERLQPRLLSEYHIVPQPLELSAFSAVVEELANELKPELSSLLDGIRGDSTAFAVGQYLSSLGLIETSEEEGLHRSMVGAAARAGCTTLVFKPHPAAPVAPGGALDAEAKAQGIELRIIDSPIIAEVILHHLRPCLVIGVFSTALATARSAYEIETVTVGTELLLERITPYQNSNRIPLTIMDWLSDKERSEPAEQELQALVDAVAYCMQPEIAQSLRPVAESYLEADSAARSLKYFKRRRLMKLDLPGGLSRTRNPRTIARRLTGIGYRLAKHQLQGRYGRKQPNR